MGRDNLLTGVGMDAYGNNYRRYRSLNAFTDMPGPETVSNAAHNVAIDIFAFGGLPLLLSYLLMIGVTLASIVRFTKRNRHFDFMFVSMASVWICYQVQSLISINQLGLGVWGWSLTGLLIGYEINTRDSLRLGNLKDVRKGKSVNEKLSAGALVLTFVTSGIGLAIALPPYLAANKFYKALQSGDANLIQPAAYLKPYDRSRFLYVAQILNENKLETEAIKVLRDASKIYPDSFELWQQWSVITSATTTDVANAKAEMRRLDPFNPDLK
jgi:hypothetical protein